MENDETIQNEIEDTDADTRDDIENSDDNRQDIVEDVDADTKDVINNQNNDLATIKSMLDNFTTRLDSFEKQLKTAQSVFIDNGGTIREGTLPPDNDHDFRDVRDVRNLNLF